MLPEKLHKKAAVFSAASRMLIELFVHFSAYHFNGKIYAYPYNEIRNNKNCSKDKNNIHTERNPCVDNVTQNVCDVKQTEVTQ
jgi:hypothetical protein